MSLNETFISLQFRALKTEKSFKMRRRKKGLTLMDALAAMIALSLTAITAQSLILLVNQFLSQKQSSMQSMENKNKVNNMICNHFSEPIFIENNPKKTFAFDSDTSTYKALSENVKKASMSVPMTGLFKNSSNTTTFNTAATSAASRERSTLGFGGFLAADQTADGTSSGVLKAHVNDKASNFNNLNDGSNSVSGNHNYMSQFFDLYSDSHTLISYQVDMSKMNDSTGVGEINRGVIFASRCSVWGLYSGNGFKGGSLHYDHNLGDTALGESAWSALSEDKKKKSRTLHALYILNNPWRPFYFPDRDKAPFQVQCCDTTSATEFKDDKPSQSEDPVTGCRLLGIYSTSVRSHAYMIDIKTLDAGDFGEDSIKGFFNNDSSALASLKEKSECDDVSDEFDYEKSECKTEATKIYQTKLKDFFTYPVQLEEIYELPLRSTYGIQNRDEHSSLGFVADYMRGTDIVKMNLFSVEDKCSSFLPAHLCKARNNFSNETGRVREEFLQTTPYICPFAYRNMKNSGNAIPLGISFK